MRSMTKMKFARDAIVLNGKRRWASMIFMLICGISYSAVWTTTDKELTASITTIHALFTAYHFYIYCAIVSWTLHLTFGHYFQVWLSIALCADMLSCIGKKTHNINIDLGTSGMHLMVNRSMSMWANRWLHSGSDQQKS